MTDTAAPWAHKEAIRRTGVSTMALATNGDLLHAIDALALMIQTHEPHLKPHPFTDEFITQYWPEITTPEGRADIRRQWDALRAAVSNDGIIPYSAWAGVLWDLKRAREICADIANWGETKAAWLKGEYDETSTMRSMVAALNEPPRVTFDIKFSNGGVIGVSLGDLLDYINKGIIQIESATLNNA